jgi:TonB family protein
MKAVSPNDALSTEQKNILNTVDPGTGITINVTYKSKNAVTDNIVNSTMSVSMMIVPEIEAEYIGGYQQLKKYLKENVISKISEAKTWQLQDANAIVLFTVDEDGEIVNTKISKTSGDAKTDKLLVDAINKMPKWKPAENSKGIKVKQEFEFSVGNSGC